MSTFPFREKDVACIHPETYKYFFHPNEVASLWERLEAYYGPCQINERFQIVELETSALFLRATTKRNPITVIRKRRCQAQDVEEFHALVKFL